MGWHTQPFLPARVPRAIVFTGESIGRVRSGRKTQTRRLMPDMRSLSAAPYHPGDRLWVRECYQVAPDGLAVLYKTDYIQDPAGVWRDNMWRPAPGPWRSPRFMPRTASRTDLIVTRTKIELLQDVSEEDAQAEGYDVEPCHGPWCIAPREAGGHWSARPVFARAWDALNAKRGAPWADNPPVLAVEFEVVK